MSNQEYLNDLFSLSGQVAVVIGGTGELCGAMAEGLAGAGAEVVLVGRNEGKAGRGWRGSPRSGGRAGSTRRMPRTGGSFAGCWTRSSGGAAGLMSWSTARG